MTTTFTETLTAVTEPLDQSIADLQKQIDKLQEVKATVVAALQPNSPARRNGTPPRALTDAQVAKVRASYGRRGVTCKSLARRFNCSDATICQALHFKGAYASTPTTDG